MTAKPATPLPWARLECERVPANKYSAQHYRFYTEGLTPEGFRNLIATTAPNLRDKEYAAYIVEACNAYPRLMAERDELVAALRFIERCADEQNTASHDGYDMIRDKARKALARIEGADRG